MVLNGLKRKLGIGSWEITPSGAAVLFLASTAALVVGRAATIGLSSLNDYLFDHPERNVSYVPDRNGDEIQERMYTLNGEETRTDLSHVEPNPFGGGFKIRYLPETFFRTP